MICQGSRLKVKRAREHIQELHAFVESFASAPDLHSVDFEPGQYVDAELVITIHKAKEELRDDAALTIGDIYHNLRSALDILWFEIVSPTGFQTKWTRFPITDTREELIGSKLNPALEKGQITETVCEFVRDTIKPYREGNFPIWSVEEANIIDKHHLLIPNFSMIAIQGVRIQNDEQVIDLPNFFTESTFRRRANHLELRSFGRNPKVIDKGHTALGYGFDLGHPQEGEAVIPTLNAVTKEVARVIEAFALLLG